MGNFREESLERHERFRKRLVAGGVVALLIFSTTANLTDTHWNWIFWSFAAALMLVFWIAYKQFDKLIRCPGCDRSVAKVFFVAPEAARCPHCGTDWTKPVDRP